MPTKLSRIDKWFGGITLNDKSDIIGASLNVEELDIFSNPSYIEPTTIFGSESISSPLTSVTSSGTTATATSTNQHGLTTGDSVTISGADVAAYNGTFTVTVTSGTVFTYTLLSDPADTTTGTIVATYSTLRKVLGYTIDDSDNAYALSISQDGDAIIWKLSSASTTNPGSWVFAYESANDAHPNSPLIWHKWASGADYLYYPTVNGTTVTLRQLGDLSTYTEGAANGTGVLDGLDGTGDRIPMIRIAGEIFIGNGKYISQVDDTGVFVQHAFELPGGWECVSFDSLSDELMILARSTEGSKNFSKVFFWDLTATTGVNDEITIPMGGPQIISNHSEVVRVFCAKNGLLRIYELLGKLPVESHKLDNISTETDLQPIIPEQTKFIKDNILYFGLWKTDKSGLYAMGQAGSKLPTALILSRRFDTSSYATHKPQAANAFGNNFYCSFDDNGTADIARLEGNNSPTRSSNAVYESILIDAGSPENSKEWRGFIAITKSMPSSCAIVFDARTDNASSYDSNATNSLTSLNDYVDVGGASGFTADRFWYRELTSVVGRLIQIKLTFMSSGTTMPVLYSIGLLSESTPLL